MKLYRRLFLTAALTLALLAPVWGAETISNQRAMRHYASLAHDVSTNNDFTLPIDFQDAHSCSMYLALTTLTGTSPTVDFLIQVGPDSTSWVAWNDPTVMSTTGEKASFVLQGNLRYFRFFWTTTGTVTAALADLFISCRKP